MDICGTGNTNGERSFVVFDEAGDWQASLLNELLIQSISLAISSKAYSSRPRRLGAREYVVGKVVGETLQ